MPMVKSAGLQVAWSWKGSLLLEKMMSHTQLKWDCEFALTVKWDLSCSVTYG